MTEFTFKLPDDLLVSLDKKAKELGLSKNKLIEKALTLYLDQLNKAEYRESYKKMAKDTNVNVLADEDMADYFSQLNEL